MNIEWREIDGFPGYEVSNDGQVRSWLNKGYLGQQGVPRETPLYLRQGRDRDGYFQVGLTDKAAGRLRTKKVHRLVAVAFLPPPAPGQRIVAHNDGSRDNNTPTNLRWTTPHGNMVDRDTHGTTHRGEKHRLHKLTEQQVREIKARCHGPKGTGTALAREFGVTKICINHIKKGRSWKWLDH